MSKVYYGNEHIFTSKKSGEEVITLRAGQDEVLNIENATLNIGSDNQVIFNNDGVLVGSENLKFEGSVLSVPSIVGTEPSGSSNNLYSKQTLQNSNTTNLKAQGSSVAISNVAGNNYLIFGCPLFPDEGGLSIFKSSLLSTFNQVGSYLPTTATTSEGMWGSYSDINEDGDIMIYTDGSTGGNIGYGSLRGRSGDTWNQTELGDYGVAVKLSNNYLLGSQYFRVVNVYSIESGETATQQELHNFGGSVGEFNELIEIIGGNTLCVINDNVLYIWIRSGTTWLNTQTITDYSGITLISLAMYGNKLIISSSSNTYVLSRASFGGNYELSTTISNSNITCITLNGSYIFVATTTVIKVYDYNYDQIGSNESATLVSKMTCNDYVLVAGRPAFNTNTGNVFVWNIGNSINPDEIINRIDLNETDLNIRSYGGEIELLSNTNITGVLSVSSNISCSGNYIPSVSGSVFTSALYTCSTSQTVNNTTADVLGLAAVYNTLTNIAYSTGVFTNNSGADIRLLISYSVSFSYQTGEKSCYILSSGSTNFYGTSTINFAEGSLCNLTGTAIVPVPLAGTFSIKVRSSGSSNISVNNTTQLTSVSIMRVP